MISGRREPRNKRDGINPLKLQVERQEKNGSKANTCGGVF
jgi:hypothetical protein